MHKNLSDAAIPEEPEEDEDDEKSEDGHLVEGHRAKLFLLLLQHSSDRFFVAKIQGISSNGMNAMSDFLHFFSKQIEMKQLYDVFDIVRNILASRVTVFKLVILVVSTLAQDCWHT